VHSLLNDVQHHIVHVFSHGPPRIATPMLVWIILHLQLLEQRFHAFVIIGHLHLQGVKCKSLHLLSITSKQYSFELKYNHRPS